MIVSPRPKSGWKVLPAPRSPASTSRYATPESNVMRSPSASAPGTGAYAVRSHTMYMEGRKLR